MTDPDAKARIRAHARQARRTFVQTLGPMRSMHEDAACLNLLQLIRDAERIAFYRAQGAEIDAAEAMEAAVEIERVVALPRVTEAGLLAFHRWMPGEPLVAGAHGLEEPAPDAPVVSPDVIVLPLVAFDRAGRRLGQGGGYYDRTLTAYPDAMRIGLAWSVQEVDEVPVEPWDVMLDAVVTEREWLECR